MSRRTTPLAMGLLLVLSFAAGWIVNGWRADARISRTESAQSKKTAAQAQQAQAATEKKANAVIAHGTSQQENTHDYTRKLAALEAGRAADGMPALQACSMTSAVPPPSAPSLSVTPLPAEISQINTSDSQPLLAKARAWLDSLAAWSRSETPR